MLNLQGIKEFNLRRHYDTQHKSEYDKFESQCRQNKIDSLQKSFEAQQNVLKNIRNKVQHWSKRPYIFRN